MIAGMESLSPAAPLTAGKPQMTQMTQMNADERRFAEGPQRRLPSLARRWRFIVSSGMVFWRRCIRTLCRSSSSSGTFLLRGSGHRLDSKRFIQSVNHLRKSEASAVHL
jgi:hypothetical protein